MTLKFWVCFFFHARCNRQDVRHVNTLPRLRDVQVVFEILFLVFFPKTFLPILLHLFFIDFLALPCFLQFYSFAGLSKTFGPKLFGLPIGPFSALTCNSRHFLWGDQFHFHRLHCTSDLFKELDICCTYHPCRFLLDHRPFLLEVIGASDFSTIPFQAHLKLVWEFLPSDVVACCSFHVVCWKVIKSILTKHFKHITQPFFF